MKKRKRKTDCKTLLTPSQSTYETWPPNSEKSRIPTKDFKPRSLSWRFNWETCLLNYLEWTQKRNSLNRKTMGWEQISNRKEPPITDLKLRSSKSLLNWEIWLNHYLDQTLNYKNKMLNWMMILSLKRNLKIDFKPNWTRLLLN